jgi:hypothetical protein
VLLAFLVAAAAPDAVAPYRAFDLRDQPARCLRAARVAGGRQGGLCSGPTTRGATCSAIVYGRAR